MDDQENRPIPPREPAPSDDAADDRHAQARSDAASRRRSTSIGVGIALGTGIGVAIGTATDDIGLWLPLGLLAGIAIPAIFTGATKDD